MDPLLCKVVLLLTTVAICYGAPDRYPNPDIVYFPVRQNQQFRDFKTNSSNFEENYQKEPVKKNDEKKNYKGAQVWNVPIDTEQKLRVVFNLTRHYNVSSWGGDHSAVDVMISEENRDTVAKILYRNNITFIVRIDDLQRNIDLENPEVEYTQDRQGHRLTWQQYHRLSDIHDYLDYLAKTHSFCSVRTIGQSVEGRDLKVLRISNGGPNKKAVWIDGGIHAREWISPATVTYLINYIVENFDGESEMIRNIEWYFLPVVNPDGYEYTHTVDRLWRKNRKRFGDCNGVDLNRNFGYKWGGKGTSQDPCSEVYCGESPFSEPESKAIKDFMDRSSADFKLYLTYHSYGQYILFPWGYDRRHTSDFDDLNHAGSEAGIAIAKAGGSIYRVGISSVVLYPAAGGSDDWAKGDKDIKYSYTIELSDTGRYGFVLPASQILKVGKESVEGLKVLAEAAYRS